MRQSCVSSPERRSFLTRLNAGAAAVAALALGGRAMAQTKSSAPGRFEPARHDQDDWMDQIPGKHRMVIDTTTNEGIGDALLFGNNFFTANRNSYGLQNSDIALIIIARHISTGYGFNDAMWAKYGAQLASGSGLTAPSTKNPHLGGGFGIEALAKLGVQFAICSMATGRLANSIAQATGAKAAEITAELTANVVPNGHMVPAGIVAISRAQERGYTTVTT